MGVVAGDGEPAGCSSGNKVTLSVVVGVAGGPFHDGVAVEDGRWEALYRDDSFLLRIIRHTTSTRTIFYIQGVSHTKLV